MPVGRPSDGQALIDQFAALGYAATAVFHIAFAAALLRKRTTAVAGPHRPTQLFVAAIATTAIWAATESLGLLRSELLWPAVGVAADALRYALWLGFLWVLVSSVSTLPDPDGTANPLASRAMGLSWLQPVVVVCLAASLASWLWRLLGPGIDAPPSRLVVAVQLTQPLLGLLLVEQLFRNVEVDLRWHAKPVCIGLAVVFAYDLFWLSETFLFGRVDPDSHVARGAVHLMALPFLLLAARRRTDWIARLQVSRTAAFHSATLLLAGAYLLVVSSAGYYVRYFGGSWGRALQLSLVFAAVAALVVAFMSTAIRARVKVFVGKHFFSYRFDYREQWLQFTAMLSTRGTPQEVGLQVIRGLANMVECPSGALWTRSEPGGGLVQAARWKWPEVPGIQAQDSSLVQFLTRTAWVVDVDQYRAQPQHYTGLELPEWLQASPNAWLVVPLLAGDDLMGFVVLAQPHTSIELNWELLDLMKTASRQAASHLGQMQATEALLEARKFEAFNRMSAFVVHDLKNIVTQLSLMLKNAERLRDNVEFQQDMLLTVESSLEKMRRLMLQLREGATPVGTAAGVDLLAIVNRLQDAAAQRGRSLQVRTVQRLATRGHDERLERVLGHLVHNALDATSGSDDVWIEVRRNSGQVQVQVGDAGCGMSEDFIRNRLFKPFSSTKAAGMGVGMYESGQYVRELGGSIDVASTVGQGTTVTVLLPLFDSQQRSDLLRSDGP